MRLLVAAAVVLLPAAAPLEAQSEDREVLAVIQQLFDGMRAKDTARMRATLHPQARMVSPGMRDGVAVVNVDTPERWLASVAGATGGPLDERTRNPVVHVDGALASVWVDYNFFVGERFNHCGVDTFHLVRTATGWKIIDLADTRRREGCTP